LLKVIESLGMSSLKDLLKVVDQGLILSDSIHIHIPIHYYQIEYFETIFI